MTPLLRIRFKNGQVIEIPEAIGVEFMDLDGQQVGSVFLADPTHPHCVHHITARDHTEADAYARRYGVTFCPMRVLTNENIRKGG